LKSNIRLTNNNNNLVDIKRLETILFILKGKCIYLFMWKGKKRMVDRGK